MGKMGKNWWCIVFGHFRKFFYVMSSHSRDEADLTPSCPWCRLPPTRMGLMMLIGDGDNHVQLKTKVLMTTTTTMTMTIAMKLMTIMRRTSWASDGLALFLLRRPDSSRHDAAFVAARHDPACVATLPPAEPHSGIRDPFLGSIK